jgi:hypothetical protein
VNHLEEFHFGGAARFALIVISILLGILTHLLWDSFTHPHSWPYRKWQILGQPVHVPFLGLIPCYKVLQHGSTIFGIAVLAIWLILRYRTSEESVAEINGAPSTMRKIAFWAVITVVAFAGAVIRAIAVVGIPTDHSSERSFAGVLIVTVIALVWWELVAYGIFRVTTGSHL